MSVVPQPMDRGEGNEQATSLHTWSLPCFPENGPPTTVEVCRADEARSEATTLREQLERVEAKRDEYDAAASENARVADLAVEEGKRQVAALREQLADSYVAHLRAVTEDDDKERLPMLLSRVQAAEKRAEEFAARAVAATEDAIDQNQARSSAEAEVAARDEAIEHVAGRLTTATVGWLTAVLPAEHPATVKELQVKLVELGDRLRAALEPPPPDTQEVGDGE